MVIKEVNEEEFSFVLCGCFYVFADLSDQCYASLWFACSAFLCKRATHCGTTPQGLGLVSVWMLSGLGYDWVLV